MKLTEKQENVIRLREEGKKYREIGAVYGFGAQRARQVYFSALRAQTRAPHWADELGAMVRNALVWSGIETREQALEEFSKPKSERASRYQIGKKSVIKILEFLGLPPDPPFHREPPTLCPHCGQRIKI